MKALVSEINGRSDYPLFNLTDNDDIVNWLLENEDISEAELDKGLDVIRLIDNDGMEDILRIVEKDIVDYRNCKKLFNNPLTY